MKRGLTTKRFQDGKVVLERAMLTKRFELELLREGCFGCKTCLKVCPMSAITASEPALQDGKLARKVTIDFLAEECNFCGECAVVCPSQSMCIMVDGKATAPVVEYGAFPTLVGRIDVAVAKCDAGCGLACVESCPVKAIAVSVVECGDGGKQIEAVDVDRDKCFYCVMCEAACPEAAIKVIKPYMGAVWLNTLRCPGGCQACVDSCPSSALYMGDDGGVGVNETFCVYCGACEEVCPAEGALRIRRTGVRHTDVKSGAWTKALDKLIAPEASARELGIKSSAKQRAVAVGKVGKQ